MLDSGASRCFFRESTNLTPLLAPVPVRLADPSRGPVVAHSSTVLLCAAVPSSSLSGLHLSSFSTNLVSTAALQDAKVTTTTPRGQRVSICTCTRTGRHLATFTRRPRSSLYTLATKPPQVAASAQVSASGQVAPPCSCRLLTHQTLLWHHCLGHPSLPRLRGMHSCLLVSGLPRSLPPLPPSPAPPCLPCVEGWQRTAPHSSSFPPTSAPLQTLHMDVWGPARVCGQGRERNFLLVVDDYTRYTTVFPLRSKGRVVDVLISWIRAVRLQLRKRFHADQPVLRLHSDRGGEFSSNLLRGFCRGEGILQSFTLPASPQQNGIAERRIGLVMEVARTSMIHAAAPHFCGHLAHTALARKVGDASVFRVWGSRAFVRDTSADKLSARAIPCVFLGFTPDAPSWQFYHPTSRHVLPSQDVMFDELVPFYRLFPYRSAPPPPPPLFLASGPPLPGTAHVEVAVGSGAARGAVSEGPASGGAEPGVVESEGAELRGEEPGGAGLAGVEPGGAELEGVEPGGAEPQCAASSGGPGGASSRLSPQQLCESLVRRARSRSGATRAGGAGLTTGACGTGGTMTTRIGGARTRGTGAAGTGGVGGAGAGVPTEPRAARAGAGDTGAGGIGASGTGVEGTRAGGAGVRGAGAVDPGGTVRPRSYFVPLLQQVLGVPSSTSLTPPLLCPPPDQSQPPPTVSRLLATAVTDPSFESAAASTLVAELLDFAAACRLDYAIALVAESESASRSSVGGECALSTDVLEDRQEECLAAVVPRFASMLLALEGDPDAPNIPTPCSYEEAITDLLPHPKMTTLRMLLHVAAQRDYQLHSLDFSTAFLQGSLHEEIWLRRPPGFTASFPAGTQWSLRRPVYGLRQVPREWHDTLRTTLAALGFAPSTADPSMFLRTNTSLPLFYVLVYVEHLTEALTLVKSELQKRHTCTDLGELRSYLGLHITRDKARRTITLTQSHHLSFGPT
ncbi:unnamed protein product [Closterium sp. NIES-54]